MAFCMPCGKSEDTTQSSELTSAVSTARKVCVRCFTFWVLIALLALGLMAHYHDSQGRVRF